MGKIYNALQKREIVSTTILDWDLGDRSAKINQGDRTGDYIQHLVHFVAHSRQVDVHQARGKFSVSFYYIDNLNCVVVAVSQVTKYVSINQGARNYFL